jgi:hypothetical protein
MNRAPSEGVYVAMGSVCTVGLNTHCTLPQCLEGFEKTLAISWNDMLVV